MFLASTSDIVRIVTGSAVSTIGVQAAWVDNASGTYTPGRTNTAITTATTTTVVEAPGASTVRNVKSLIVTNNHASSSCVVTIQHFDGTTSVDLAKITLYAGEQFVMCEDGEWRHLTRAGAEYEHAGLAIPNLGITGTVAETIPREICTETNAAALTSGQLRFFAIYLRAGQVVTNISFFSATTAAGTPTNQFFALYSRHGIKLAQSANDTTTAWAANTIKTLAMTAAYTVRETGFYYIGIMVAATTVPTLKGESHAVSTLDSRPFTINGTAESGLTTSIPDMTGSIPSGVPGHAWAAIT